MLRRKQLPQVWDQGQRPGSEVPQSQRGAAGALLNDYGYDYNV